MLKYCNLLFRNSGSKRMSHAIYRFLHTALEETQFIWTRVALLEARSSQSKLDARLSSSSSLYSTACVDMLPWICGFLRMCARTSATANSPIYRYIQCMYAYDIWIRGVIVRLCGWEWNAARITRYSQHNHKPTMSTQCVLCSSTRKHPQFSYRARAQSSALHLRTPPHLSFYILSTLFALLVMAGGLICVCVHVDSTEFPVNESL